MVPKIIFESNLTRKFTTVMPDHLDNFVSSFVADEIYWTHESTYICKLGFMILRIRMRCTVSCVRDCVC